MSQKLSKLITLINQAASGCQVFPSLEAPLKSAANTILRDPLTADDVIGVISPFIKVLQCCIGFRTSPTSPIAISTKVPNLVENTSEYTLVTIDSTQWRILQHSAGMIEALLASGCELPAKSMVDLAIIFTVAAVSYVKHTPSVSAPAEKVEVAGGGAAKGAVTQLLVVVEAIVALFKRLQHTKLSLHTWISTVSDSRTPSDTPEAEERRALRAHARSILKRHMRMPDEGGAYDSDSDDDDNDALVDNTITPTSTTDDVSTSATHSHGGLTSRLSGAELEHLVDAFAFLLTSMSADIATAPELKPAGAVLNSCVDLALVYTHCKQMKEVHMQQVVQMLADTCGAAVVTAVTLTRKLPASQELLQDCLRAARRALTLCADIITRYHESFPADLCKRVAGACIIAFMAVPLILVTMKSWHVAVLEANEGEASGVRKDGRVRTLPAQQKARILAATAAEVPELKTTPTHAEQAGSSRVDGETVANGEKTAPAAAGVGSEGKVEPSKHTPHEFVVRGVTLRGGKAILATVQEGVAGMLSAALHAYELSRMCGASSEDWPSVSALRSTPEAAAALTSVANTLHSCGNMVHLHMFDGEAVNVAERMAFLIPTWALDSGADIPASCQMHSFIQKNPQCLTEHVLAMIRSHSIVTESAAYQSTVVSAATDVWKTLIAGISQIAKYSTSMQCVLLSAVDIFVAACGCHVALTPPESIHKVIAAVAHCVKTSTSLQISSASCMVLLSLTHTALRNASWAGVMDDLSPLITAAADKCEDVLKELVALKEKHSKSSKRITHSAEESDEQELAEGQQEFSIYAAFLMLLKLDGGALLSANDGIKSAVASLTEVLLTVKDEPGDFEDADELAASCLVLQKTLAE